MAREFRVTARCWSPRGEAVGNAFGKGVHVWNGIPGEDAQVRVAHEGQNQIHAIWAEARRPSPHRVRPPCDRYHPCGGCPLMHVNAEGQADARRSLVLDALHAEGLSDVAVGSLTACPDGHSDFRHVVKLGVGFSDQGRLRVGAWGRRSRAIVPIPKCDVAAPILRRVMSQIAHLVIDLGLAPYDPETDRGVLRAFVLRASRHTGEVLVTVVAGRRTRALKDLAEGIAATSEVVGVALHVNQEFGNAIFDREDDGSVGIRILTGRGHIEEQLGDITYRIGPADFFQTNPSTAEVLYRRTLERLELGKEVPFVDLYSGVGGFALPASKITGWAIGIEVLDGAVSQAREAARRNDAPAEFIAGRVGDILPDLARRRLRGAHPIVTVNPARRGLEEGVVDQIMALRPRRVAYVSCNPRAMARDLKAFSEAGMRIGDIELYDMFPNTPHVEAVAILHGIDDGQPARRAPRRRVVR